MKTFFRKALIYAVLSVLAIPTTLYSGLLTVGTAMAANADIIIDNDDADFSSTGAWTLRDSGDAHGPAGYNSNFRVENDSTATRTATWTPTITSTGVYEVKAHWSAAASRPANVVYNVNYSGGSAPVSVNQQMLSDQITAATNPNGQASGWMSLGSFNFETGTTGNVSITEVATGNTCADAIEFVHTNIAPTAPVLTTPLDNIYSNSSSTIDLSWSASTDSDDASFTYTVKINGSNVATGLTTTTYSLDVSAAPDGAYTWQIVADDGVDTAASAIRNFTLDKVAPAIDSITTVAGTTGDNATVTVTASDTNAMSAEINYDGNWYAMTGSGPFTYDVPVPADSLATINYQARVTDAATNFSVASGSISPVTDNDAPVIASISSTPNTTGETTTITVNASDNIGITSAQIDVGTGFFVPMLNPSAGVYIYPVLVPLLGTTPINYTVAFDDAAGNGPVTQAGSITPIDDDAPVITSVTGNSGTTGETTLVTVNATDNVAPTSAEISIDGGSYTAMTGTASPFTYDVPVPTNSTATISYSINVYDAAGDPAGNVINGGPYSITVTDNDAPVGSAVPIEINNNDFYTNSKTVSLTLSGTDDVDGTPADMCIKTSTSVCTSTGWVTYDTSSSLTTTWTTSGSKKIYVWFRDAAGNVSARYNDLIYYDGTNPTGPSGLSTSPNPTNNTTQSWGWTAGSDADSGLEGYYYRIGGDVVVSETPLGDVSSFVSNFIEGHYQVYLLAKDNAGNSSSEISFDLAVDTTAPVIALSGSSPIDVEVHTSYTDAGATASDNFDGDITGWMSTVNSVNIDQLGTYTVTYNVSDSAGNAATEVVRTVNVVDTTIPVITLTDPNPQTVEAGSTYVDPGYSASDNYDGDLTASVVADYSNIDMSTVGTYTVTYNVADSSTNAATEVTRTVNVVDTTAPVINSISSSPDTTGEVSIITVEATDNTGITSAQIDTGTGFFVPMLNPSAGVYTYPIAVPLNSLAPISYTVSFDDAYSNGPTTQAATITPTDNDTPTITGITGSTTGTTGESVTISATATDNIGFGNATITYGGVTYDMTGAGPDFTYDLSIPADSVATISYFVTVYDAAGNPATSSTYNVSVTDNDVPVITLTGDAEVTVEVFGSYTELGATWTDLVDGSGAANVGGDTVDTNQVGTYTVRYNYTDAAGNPAVEVTRTVRVVDLSAPVSDLVAQTTNPTGDNTPTYTGTTEDGVSNIAGVEYRVDGGSWVAADPTDGAYDSTTEDFTFNPGPLTDGEHLIEVRAYDTAGNYENTYSSDTLTVDTTGPAITGVTNGETYSTAKTVTIGDDAVSILINDVAYAGSKIFTISDNGGYSITATDAVGIHTLVSFTIDIPPVLSSEATNSASTTSITITWTTDQPATSRVVYDTVSHPDISGYAAGSNYGYTNSTATFDMGDSKTKNHSITISGLAAGTTYYYRTVSTGSPEVVSSTEYSFTTSPATPTPAAAETTTTATTSTVSTAAAAPSATETAPAEAATPDDSQGVVKAADTTSPITADETTNWTPWIVLAALVILAGAVTGGYFYWFSGREEMAAATAKDIKTIKDQAEKGTTIKVREKSKSASDKNKSGKKKPNRW